MPTYEYHCSQCETTFEHFQKMSEAPLTDCPAPQCGGKGTVKRLIAGGAGLIFKGSGFYITDYKNGQGKAGAAGAKTETAPVCEAKAENNPAACPCAAPGATKTPCAE